MKACKLGGLFLALVLLCACGGARPQAQEEPLERVSFSQEIFLENGATAVLLLVVDFDSGLATYAATGERSEGAGGMKLEEELSADELEDLQALIYEHNFFDLPEELQGGNSGGSYATIGVTVEGKTHTCNSDYPSLKEDFNAIAEGLRAIISEKFTG